MNEEQHGKSIRSNVLAAIDAGKVKMRPRWHFIARAALLVTGTILAALALLYVSSFIFFILHQTGVWFTPRFGLRGFREFLIGLPWMLVLLAAVFIVILQFLVKRYAFGYGRPLLYSAIGIVVLVILGGFIIAMTPVHRGLFEQARQNHLPFAGGLYREYGIPNPQGNVTPGEIIEVIESGYRMITPRDENVVIIVTPETRFPLGTNFETGDRILVLGDRVDDIITAFGIREITDDAMRVPGRAGPPNLRPPFK